MNHQYKYMLIKLKIGFKNGENLPHLKITKVVLVHCDIVNNDYQ